MLRRSQRKLISFASSQTRPLSVVSFRQINAVERALFLPIKSNFPVISKQIVRPFSALPAHKIVRMPSLSPTMESGSISRWNVKEGGKFEPGSSLCDVETDKATVSFDATDEGYLAKILVGSGEVKVGQPIMVTVDEAKDVSAFTSFVLSSEPSAPSVAVKAPAATTSPVVPATPAVSSQSTTTAVQSPSSATASTSDRIFASPLAKKLARESNVTISDVFGAVAGKGSGANNRLVAADVLKGITVLSSTPKASSAPTAIPVVEKKALIASSGPSTGGSGPFFDYELTDAARQLANRLTTSKQAIPHYYVSVEINLSELMKVREQFNKQLVSGKKSKDKSGGLSVLDFLVKAAAMAMKQVPDVNASWMETFVRRYDQADINLVMGAGSFLATPLLRNVSGRGLLSLSEEIQQFEQSLFSNDSATVGKFLSDDAQQAVGTFTIHNLGVYGVKSAAPIVISPQSCALAFGAIQEVVVPRKNVMENEKEWEVAPVMMATLSCDHRVVDGAVSAQYLAALKQLAENPLNLML